MNRIGVKRLAYVTAVLALFACPAVVTRADDAVTQEDTERKERLEFMKRQAAEYEVTLNGATPHTLSYHNDAILRFSNPVSGVRDGIIVMWKDGTRPAIFGQV